MKQRDAPYGLLQPPEHSFWVIPLRHASGAVTKQEKILKGMAQNVPTYEAVSTCAYYCDVPEPCKGTCYHYET